MLGEPGNRVKQLAVLHDAFRALQTLTEPGEHLELPYRWEGAPVVFRGKPLVEGPYS